MAHQARINSIVKQTDVILENSRNIYRSFWDGFTNQELELIKNNDPEMIKKCKILARSRFGMNLQEIIDLKKIVLTDEEKKIYREVEKRYKNGDVK